MNDENDVPAPTSRQAPRRHVPAGAAVLALLGLIAAGCGAQEPEQTKGAAAESQELTLQPVGAAGPDPFTASTSTAESAPVQPPVPNKSGQGIRTVGAATPGLYGGTNRLGSCDVERQAAYLTADDAKARAFAQATGIEQEKIPEFLRGLTPVVLRADTRITNHGFRDGHADGYQSVLQAGTAVLVDDHGMPRVRCGCGNPLAAPRSAKGNPVLKGEQWNGYRPNQVVVIEPTIQPIKRLVIVNLADNTWIERKAGDDGAQDKAPKVPPPYDPAEGIPNSPPTPPDDPSDPCATAGTSGPPRTAPPTAPPAPPSGPPSDQPPPTGPQPLPETAPPLDAPSTGGQHLPETAPPLDAPSAGAQHLPETAPPLDVPSAGAQHLPETAPPLDLPGQAGPLGAPAETAPLDAPPAAGPPGAPAQAGPLDEQLPVPAEPGVPGEAGVPGPPSATGPTPTTPCPSDSAPTAPGGQTPPQAPATPPPGDLPSGTTTPADPFSDVPTAPTAPLAPVPAEPGLTPDPQDVPTTGPAAPADPFGFPDQQPGTDQGADQSPNLESA
ncbi:hypothetical protein BX286_6165 [Streptomyces sp. 3211.6]|uniref:DUF6777 domain-containing protein n=1 Tax=Streptomyces sp. 3211.6 TaxID=1938845 RepID=UPI000EB1CC4E|nr:DUF6777 domain-containing protein [Streptomyces sp. 3211.6]RKT08085.1 hypothetical protein BX286_6165 [Streptomyces sp. 3211.6]